MAYHINRGSYGETILDGLNVLILDSFKGNIWAGDGVLLFFQERNKNTLCTTDIANIVVNCN